MKMVGSRSILIIGDIAAMALVTIIGFVTHGEADTSFLPRMAAAFFPLTAAWFLLSPWFGLFDPKVTMNSKQFWRPALAMVFAGPMAVVLRGLLLNAAIIPIFAVVLSATSAAGMVVWRVGWYFLGRKAGIVDQPFPHSVK
jgi:hypothetical protein